MDREDVDDPAIAPVEAGELDGLDEERQRDRHVHGARHRNIGIGSGTDEFEPILLDIPNRRIGGDRHLAEPHVSQQAPVCVLDCITPQHAGKSSADRRHQAEQPAPVDVDVILGLQAQRERRDFLGAEARREREPENRRARAQRDDRGMQTSLFEGTDGPTTDAIAPLPPVAARATRWPSLTLVAYDVIGGKGRRFRPATLDGRRTKARPASVNNPASSRNPSTHSRVRVITLKYCRRRNTSIRAPSALTMRAQRFADQGRWSLHRTTCTRNPQPCP